MPSPILSTVVVHCGREYRLDVFNVDGLRSLCAKASRNQSRTAKEATGALVITDTGRDSPEP